MKKVKLFFVVIVMIASCSLTAQVAVRDVDTTYDPSRDRDNNKSGKWINRF
jgi:hypothetical protein